MFGKKSSERCPKKPFLYPHEYRDQNMGGKKRAKQFFQKHTNMATKKCWEKNRRKKVRKNVFYIHTNIMTKIWGGGKPAKQFFQKHTNSASTKCREKNRPKKLSLYSHEYREQKMGGKKRAKQFFQNTRIVRQKRGKQSPEKVRNYVFHIHTNIVTKKWVKNGRNNFSRNTRVVREKKGKK